MEPTNRRALTTNKLKNPIYNPVRKFKQLQSVRLKFNSANLFEKCTVTHIFHATNIPRTKS